MNPVRKGQFTPALRPPSGDGKPAGSQSSERCASSAFVFPSRRGVARSDGRKHTRRPAANWPRRRVNSRGKSETRDAGAGGTICPGPAPTVRGREAGRKTGVLNDVQGAPPATSPRRGFAPSDGRRKTRRLAANPSRRRVGSRGKSGGRDAGGTVCARLHARRPGTGNRREAGVPKNQRGAPSSRPLNKGSRHPMDAEKHADRLQTGCNVASIPAENPKCPKPARGRRLAPALRPGTEGRTRGRGSKRRARSALHHPSPPPGVCAV